ncbi:MAG: A/G-specific adenine glycosylase [Alphaproteobacteria bacterium]
MPPATKRAPKPARPSRKNVTARDAAPAPFADLLLRWYDRHRRVLPWRAPPGIKADPYKVWLSEIMLQQTTVAAVGPYFRAFTERWPTVATLAATPLDDLLAAWAGLGYYARARNLHACARHVSETLGGVFPNTLDGLRELPGVGPYTAAAIAAIAFDVPAAAVDGNVERVVSRLYAIERPLPASKPEIKRLAEALVPERRAGDFAQAMMDLGATICTPRGPACAICPVSVDCEARKQGIAAELPKKAAKKARPFKRAAAFWIVKGDSVLLRRRAPKGLLGGMLEVPSSEWREGELDLKSAAKDAPLKLKWFDLPGVVRHGFTHFELEFAVLAGHAPKDAAAPQDCVWWPRAKIMDAGLPTVFAKIARHAP